MMATQFGTASAISIMPIVLPKSATGIAHFEAYCNNAGATATVQFQGSISGSQWSNVGSALSLSGTTPQWSVTTAVNYNYYRAQVTAIAGTSATVSAFMGS